MKAISLTVLNEEGIHARPLAVFIKAAGAFKGTKLTIRNVTTESKTVSATSSLLLVTAIKAKKGHEIEVTADGPQEDEALAAIRAAVESGLGE